MVDGTTDEISDGAKDHVEPAPSIDAVKEEVEIVKAILFEISKVVDSGFIAGSVGTEVVVAIDDKTVLDATNNSTSDEVTSSTVTTINADVLQAIKV